MQHVQIREMKRTIIGNLRACSSVTRLGSGSEALQKIESATGSLALAISSEENI